MVVIGIGQAGCNIISHFSKGHKKIKIDIEKFPSTCKKTEDFEAKCPSLKKELNFRANECWVFLCGAGKVAGATLRILEKIRNKKINIVYISPDPDMSTPIQLKRHRVVYNVLQEYTRSGLLNSMNIISNRSALNTIGEGPISSVYNLANQTIANIVETIEFFKTETPVLGSLAKTKEISRIRTFGIGFLEKNQEKMLFPLDNTTEISYIYSISKEELEERSDLLSIIKQKVVNDRSNNIISSFSIFSSLYDKSFYYSIKCTHYIQKEEK